MIYRYYRIDKQDLFSLSKEEKDLLKILESVVKDISFVYELQLKEGFYPKGLTKQQLEKEAEVNPDVLSPYSYVIKKNGRVETIPYHIHYAEYLVPIAKKNRKSCCDFH